MSEAMFKVLKASIDILNEDVRQQCVAERQQREDTLYCDLCQGLCKEKAYHKVVRESYEHAMKYRHNKRGNNYKALE